MWYSMGRNYNKREFDQLDKLKKENRQLKIEVARLRKLADKAVNYEQVLAITKEKKKEEKQKSKEEWLCWECGRGYLRIIRLYQRNGVYYFRACDKCEHRTKKKKWSKDVKGLE